MLTASFFSPPFVGRNRAVGQAAADGTYSGDSLACNSLAAAMGLALEWATLSQEQRQQLALRPVLQEALSGLAGVEPIRQVWHMTYVTCS